jgi:hypothetical protein
MITPLSGTGLARRRYNMPRALKLPPTCRCSSLSQTSAQSTPRDLPETRISGVVRKKSGWVASWWRAAAMAARSIMQGLR